MSQTNNVMSNWGIGGTSDNLLGSLHDLACEYVIAHAKGFVEVMDSEPWECPLRDGECFDLAGDKAIWREGDILFLGQGNLRRRVEVPICRDHVPVTQGNPLMPEILGFIDVCFSYSDTKYLSGERRKINLDKFPDIHSAIRAWDDKDLWESCSDIEQGEWAIHSEKGTCGVLIAAKKTSIGTMIRQAMPLRGRIDKPYKWIVVTSYPLRQSEVLTLHRHEFRHIHLGGRFRRWAQEELDAQELCVEV